MEPWGSGWYWGHFLSDSRDMFRVRWCFIAEWHLAQLCRCLLNILFSNFTSPSIYPTSWLTSFQLYKINCWRVPPSLLSYLQRSQMTNYWLLIYLTLRSNFLLATRRQCRLTEPYKLALLSGHDVFTNWARIRNSYSFVLLSFLTRFATVTVV